MLLQPSATAPARTEGLSATISPGIILSVAQTRGLLMGLANDGVRRGGLWDVVPGQWRRYDRAWGPEGVGEAKLVGTIFCMYDKPTRYMTTLFRASITEAGLAQDWTVDRLCDDALWHGGLTLELCSRGATVSAPRVYNDGYGRPA